MTAALEEGEWSAARPDHTFTLWKDPVPILQDAGWTPGPVWTGGKSRPHRDPTPDRPARSSVAIPTELPGPPKGAGAISKKSDVKIGSQARPEDDPQGSKHAIILTYIIIVVLTEIDVIYNKLNNIKTAVLTIFTAMTCNLPAIKSPSNGSWGVSITLSMPPEYQQWFTSDGIKHKGHGISTSNGLPPRHVLTLHDTYPRSLQHDRRIQSSSYHPTPISYILILSSQLPLSSKRPISFTFSHQNFVKVSLPAHICKCPTCLIRLAVECQYLTRSKIHEYPLSYCYFLPCRVKYSAQHTGDQNSEPTDSEHSQNLMCT